MSVVLGVSLSQKSRWSRMRVHQMFSCNCPVPKKGNRKVSCSWFCSSCFLLFCHLSGVLRRMSCLFVVSCAYLVLSGKFVLLGRLLWATTPICAPFVVTLHLKLLCMVCIAYIGCFFFAPSVSSKAGFAQLPRLHSDYDSSLRSCS